MVKSPQNIIVDEINSSNKNKLFFDTTGETPDGLREAVHARVCEKGVSPSDLEEDVGFQIGKVWFKKDKERDYTVKKIELKDWVTSD